MIAKELWQDYLKEILLGLVGHCQMFTVVVNYDFIIEPY